MVLKVLFAAFFAVASVQSAEKPETASAPTISSPTQTIATVVRCKVTRTDDPAIYGRNESEIYYLVDTDFRIWNDNKKKWASVDNAAQWNGKYYTANSHESVNPGYALSKKWIFNRSVGYMTYTLKTTHARHNGNAFTQNVVETNRFDFRCERALDPSQPNGSNAF